MLISIRDAMHKAESVGMDCWMTLVSPSGKETRIQCPDPFMGIWRINSGAVFADTLEEIGMKVQADSISMNQ